MICFTGYRVIDEKPRVGHLGHFFRAPVGKTLRRIKSDLHLFNGLDELFHHAKFVEDRTTRAGCRCENVVFVRPMALFVRGWHNLKKYCVMVYGSILMQSTSYFSE